MTICIPARDEAALIGRTLGALLAQRAADGAPLPPHWFDIVVFANNCSDDTAAVVRALAERAPQVDLMTVEDRLPPGEAHIGTARKYVLDLAAARFLRAGRPDGILASIDSDTLPQADWVAAIANEIRGRDAVAGHVTIAEADHERLLAPVRLLYARELTYRRVLAEVEALVDPRPEDPLPRHGSFVGASFAVTVAAYLAAGGLPALRRLEDQAFSRALRRIDARIRYSPAVRATTSARLAARVDGGFGTFIADLHACARRGESFSVEHPLRTLEDLESRAGLRRIRAGSERSGDVARVAEIFNLPPREWLPVLDSALPLGTAYERIAQQTEAGRRSYPAVRVETAIATLRAAAAGRSRSRLTAVDAIVDEDAG